MSDNSYRLNRPLRYKTVLNFWSDWNKGACRWVLDSQEFNFLRCSFLQNIKRWTGYVGFSRRLTTRTLTRKICFVCVCERERQFWAKNIKRCSRGNVGFSPRSGVSLGIWQPGQNPAHTQIGTMRNLQAPIIWRLGVYSYLWKFLQAIPIFRIVKCRPYDFPWVSQQRPLGTPTTICASWICHPQQCGRVGPVWLQGGGVHFKQPRLKG